MRGLSIRLTYNWCFLWHNVVILRLNWIRFVLYDLICGFDVFRFFDFLFVARMFVGGPVSSLVLSATIDNFFATVAGFIGFLQTDSATVFNSILRPEECVVMN